MTTGVPITFAAVAQQLAAHGWRPFPGLQTSKTPAMQGWSGLNVMEWDDIDLAATINEYRSDNYCCCLAVQPEIVAIDSDIIDPAHAAFADGLANDIIGETPLRRVGLAPKQIRIYRAKGAVKSRKLHPLEVFSGTGQIVGFGWHAKAGRPYTWPQASPLTIDSNSDAIPAVNQAQLDRFTAELFKVVPRRLITKQCRPGSTPQTIGDRLRMLTTLHGSWKRAAIIVLKEACPHCHGNVECPEPLSEACEGSYNDTLWALVTSAAGRGISEDVIWELVKKCFGRNLTASEIKVLESMIERTRPVPRRSLMTFALAGGSHG